VIEKEAPIHVSNVMVVDPDDNKPTRVRIERAADGARQRVSVRTGTKLQER
jgi:large subunit ribosomal protein L24